MGDSENHKLTELQAQIQAQAIAIEEIRETQIKIANALLGSFDKNSVGLIEEVRTLRKEVDLNNNNLQRHEVQISELSVFRSDTKKIVAAIALAVPMIFELIKGLVGLVWEFIKGGGSGSG